MENCLFCDAAFDKKNKLYTHIRQCHRLPEDRPGWVYCIGDGMSEYYKCGMSISNRTRAEMEQYLISKYRHAYPYVQIHHMVSSANPKYELASLVWELDEFKIARNFFAVDDVRIIVNAMDDLVLG